MEIYKTRNGREYGIERFMNTTYRVFRQMDDPQGSGRKVMEWVYTGSYAECRKYVDENGK